MSDSSPSSAEGTAGNANGLPEDLRPVEEATSKVAARFEAYVKELDQREAKAREAEIAARRAAWKKPAPRYTRGVLAKFARNAATASRGAVLDGD